MSAAAHTNNAHAALDLAHAAAAAEQQQRPLPSIAQQLDLACVFADTVVRYLSAVLPLASRELADWCARSDAIPNTELRHTAARALGKRGNIEGAALFATLAPPAHRRSTVRALVAFQTAYNYLDALSELPSDDPAANAERLHEALLAALQPGAPHPDYYACSPQCEDGGYLQALVETCRGALARLPSYAAVAPLVLRAAARIVDFQVLNLSDPRGVYDPMRRWAADCTPPGSGLQWWETAAAAGSSLAVHALIAAAADPHLDVCEAREIDAAYFPWLGALHSLLDSLVDRVEDYETAQRSLLGYYRSPADAAAGLSRLARCAREFTGRLGNPYAHGVITAAMCSYYLSAPQCATAESEGVTRALTAAMGPSLSIAIVMFRSRRLFRTVTRRSYT